MKDQIETFGIKFTYNGKQIVDMMNGTADLYERASYVEPMFEEMSPTCDFTDSGSIRPMAGVVTFLYGTVAMLRFLA